MGTGREGPETTSIQSKTERPLSTPSVTLASEQTQLDWGAPSQPKPASALAFGALAAGLGILGVAAFVLFNLRGLLQREAVASSLADVGMLAALLGCAALLWPVAMAWVAAVRVAPKLAANDLVGARIAASASRNWSMITFGYAFAALLLLGSIAFFTANEGQVAKTFFDGPLILQFFPLVARAFLVNVLIFIAAEILVLIWGLMVAVARLMPGEAGRPVRTLATLYCDVFRGFPAIITIYLIGFGIPLSGMPFLGDLPLPCYAIFALTLVYGAYVAEVYRAGIESVHWSQMAAARSLGLSQLQALRHVIMPQAVRRIIPPLLNDFIGLQKDTALVQVIGVLDSFNQSRIIASNHFNLSAVTIVGILFVLITIPQARLVDKLVEHDQRRMRAGG